jgi:uncharacterized protein
MMEPPPAARPLPLLSPETEFFWTAGRDGVLRLLRCRSCGYYIHPPSPRCPRCLGDDLGPEPVSGRGTLFSYTVNHQPWGPGVPLPYVIGLVALEEQPQVRLTTNVVDCPEGDLAIGMELEVVFEAQDDVWFPLFRPPPVNR